MATERDLELLDDYLANRLSAEEKTSFEQKLRGDKDLAQEHNLQQHLVRSIQKARVNELKAMLNNVPVSPVPHGGSSILAKFAMGTIVAGAVATGVYFYVNSTESKTEIEQPVTNNEIPLNDSSANTSEAETPTISETADAEVSVPAPTKESDKTSEPTAKKPQPKTENKQPAINVFDPTTEEESEVSESNISTGKSQPASVDKSEPSIAVEIDRTSKSYAFHYQFKEGKLFLYGPFEKNLYEIMEFFNENKRTVFLYYKDNYYLLKEENDQIKPLAVISDATLIEKLKNYRTN